MTEFQFSVEWKEQVDCPACRTAMSLAVVVAGMAVWPVVGEPSERLECFADDVLSQLAECWKAITLRQIYPIPVQPERPSLLRPEAEKRWALRPPTQVEFEEERVSAFEDTHNFANAFGGQFGVPALWLFRMYDELLVETADRVWPIPYQTAVSVLGSVGDEIAQRLEQIDANRWGSLIGAWKARNKGDQVELLAWSLSVDVPTARMLISSAALVAPVTVAEAANDDEIKIAARMAGSLRANQIAEIIAHIRGIVHRDDDIISRTDNELDEYLNSEGLSGSYPYKQGTRAAIWLRDRLGLGGRKYVDPFKALRHLNVDVRALSVDAKSLDAIAVWGPRQGPGVLLNYESSRFNCGRDQIWRNGAARITAAHELCHLLFDRRHAFSFVEVLQNRIPVQMEQRARAFAAEFLLPSSSARLAWNQSNCPQELSAVHSLLGRLCRSFGVTMSVAAWQLEHGVSQSEWPDISVVLEGIVPQR